MFEGQLVNSVWKAKTQTNTGLRRAGQLEFRPKIGPKMFRSVGRMWAETTTGPTAFHKKSWSGPLFWCARRDLNPRPIDP